MSPATPTGRDGGRESARKGAGHWWAQKLTSIALVPLTLWFIPSMAMLAGQSHGQVVAWLGAPLNTLLMVLLLAITFYHAWLGLETIIEDYVHTPRRHVATMVVMKIAIVILALAAFVAVAKIAVGS